MSAAALPPVQDAESHLLDYPPMNIQPFGQVKLHRLEQRRGLESLALGHNIAQRHVWPHHEAVLRDDRSLVQVHRHEMRRNSDDLDALLIRLAVGLRSRKTR